MPEEPVALCRTCHNVAVNGTIDGECDSCHVKRVLNVQDNERMPPAPQPPQQSQVQLNAQVTPQGALLSCAYPMQLGLPAEMMDQLTEEWIMQRPALLQKIAQKSIAARKQELQIIRHINSSKIN
jgi:hypothetical protein